MKKLLIILASAPLLANAQDSLATSKSQVFSFAFYLSPDYSFRTLKNNDGSSSSDFVIKARNSIETGKPGFTTGISTKVNGSKRVSGETGLYYSTMGYKIGELTLDYQQPDPGLPTKMRSAVNFHYISIPVKLNFTAGNGRPRFIAGAGLAANFLLKESEKFTLTYADGSERNKKESSTHDYKKFNISSLTSIGFEYKLKEKIFLRAEPTLRYGLLKIIDTPVTEHLWSIGLNMGVYIEPG